MLENRSIALFEEWLVVLGFFSSINVKFFIMIFHFDCKNTDVSFNILIFSIFSDQNLLLIPLMLIRMRLTNNPFYPKFI